MEALRHEVFFHLAARCEPEAERLPHSFGPTHRRRQLGGCCQMAPAQCMAVFRTAARRWATR